MGEKKIIQTFFGKAKWPLLGLVFMAVLSTGTYLWYLNKGKSIEITMGINDIDFATSVKFGESLENMPIIMLNGTNVAKMTPLQQMSFINSELEEFQQRTITASYNDLELRTNLGELGFELKKDSNEILSELEKIKNDKKEHQSSIRTRIPLISEIELDYSYQEEKIEIWVENLANQINVSKVEPTLLRAGGGFNVTPGRTGINVMTTKLSDNIHEELLDLNKEAFQVGVEVEYINPTTNQTALESVNSRISSATSIFPLSDSARVHNVKLAAQKVNGIVLLPGQEFSFGANVEPVTFAGGYQAATIFIDGETSQGVGGGICQISSTLYWAQLRAGILATQRRGHSLPVGYVPLGLDATYATGGIDYRFANTLDYPIYISAYTNGNVLTIELWSNNQALNGLSFEPRVAQVENNNQSQTWSTFLRTYNANGGLVSERHLHNSTYRHPRG